MDASDKHFLYYLIFVTVIALAGFIAARSPNLFGLTRGMCHNVSARRMNNDATPTRPYRMQ